MKKIVLISTFCDTEQKQNVFRDTVIYVKKLGLDVMAISPNFIKIDEDIVEMCDFFFYTKENPLLEWPIRQYTHWFEKQIDETRVCTIHRGFADYGWAALYQTKKLSEIALTFDYDIFHHIIYDLEITEEVEKDMLNGDVNVIRKRKNPNNENEIWETTLHFMTFDRSMMEKITDEITLDEYLSTNGVAEGEVLKWRDKYNLKTSDYLVKDKIFYWENFDFFNYSPFDEFKMFVSKNEETKVWLGYNKDVYKDNLSDNLRIVFHSFKNIDKIKVEINDVVFDLKPINWEIVELPIKSGKVNSFNITYNNMTKDFTDEYKKIMRNLVYYNYRK